MGLQRRFSGILELAALLSVCGPGMSADAQPSSVGRRASPVDAIPPEMLAHDSVLSGPFTAHFEIRIDRNLLGPDKGRHTKVCHYAASDANVGLSVETRYEADPPYRTLAAPGYRELDFDADGNLIVWRSLRKFCLSTPDFNRTYDEQETMLIEPTGKVRSRTRGVTVYEYPVDSRVNLYEFDQFRLAAGRNFLGEVETFKAQHSLPNGIRELVFEAPFGTEMRADWFLYVDTHNGGLVRQADRFVPTVEGPSLHMENRGILRKDGVALAKEGLLSYALGEGQEFMLKVTVVDFASRPDEEHLGRIRAILTGPFPPDTKILDHRELFSHHGVPNSADPEK